ncbi:hypothetical protein [Metapseudomonas furukawaii]|nr:hypothetical protein [Pseudomonas furukawaii]
MSDYFAALMRSSGLFSHRAEQAPEAPPELEMDVPAPRAPDAPGPAIGIPRERVPGRETPMPTNGQPHPAPDPAHHGQSRPAPSIDPGDLPQWQQAAPDAPRPREQVPAPGAPSQDGPPRPPQADELLRAAMHWVASDPQQAASAQRASLDRATQPHPGTPDTATTRVAAVPPHTMATPGQSRRPAPADGDRAQEVVTTPEPVPLAPRVAAPAILRAEPDGPDGTAEEPLTISIGAIHLRVEAPAPQTVARPAAPTPPAQRPAAPASPTRSGLSRRALRRL